jgi:hypothetical protein
MRPGIGKNFLLIIVGAIVGWLGHLVLANREVTSSTAAATALELKSVNPSESRPNDERRTKAASDQTARAADSSPSVSADATASEKGVSADADSTLMILSPLHSGDSAESESNTAADATDRAEKARDDLKHAMLIRCDFSPGATGFWMNQKLNVSLFQWQGGPITFEVVDLGAGTARMLGSDGVTGSQEGVIDVMVTATSTGLHFSTFTPTRALVVATVFANLDASGKYRAVMSRHGSPTFYENISEQNYGSCDIGLTQLRPRSN